MPGDFNWAGFVAQFAASAAYNITYAPSVSDYSRYLPRHTRPPQIIAAVFLGATSAAIWLISLGGPGWRHESAPPTGWWLYMTPATQSLEASGS